MRERCHRCYTILTSEDKHHYGISCEECEIDAWYRERIMQFPLHQSHRYALYQLRWVWHTPGAGRDLLLHGVRRLLANDRPQRPDGSRR